MIHQQIAILDFGSQYTHLISRRIRDFCVCSKIYPPNVNLKKLKKENIIGIILSGGPQSVYNQNAVGFNPQIFDLNKPILGLCYGHQLIAHHLGGKVKAGEIKEYGFALLKIVKHRIHNTEQDLFSNLKSELTVWMSHGDQVIKAPPGFKILGATNDCDVAVMGNNKRQIYGLQFHPEVHHTKDQDKILYNFVVHICEAKQDWKIKNLIKEIRKQIKKQVQNKKVFMLVSGGVDSTVAFALLEKTLGKKNIIGLHINSGLMRKNESQQVKKNLAKAGFDDLNIVNAGHFFLKRLKKTSDPEQKRKIIGQTYLDVAKKWWQQNCSKITKKNQILLGQGTIYPDTIESGRSQHADVIKTHHNRIDTIQQMIKQGKIIEPLKNFYKDEVRIIGKNLNLPQKLLQKHPFPGPGLGIRTLCSGKKIKLPKIDLNINNPKIKSQLLPIKSVGVQGDNRTYAYCITIWGINDWQKLSQISTKITNTYSLINRVIKLIYPKNPQKIEFHQKENSFLTSKRLSLLAKINTEIEKEVHKAKIYHQIWQFPIVLAPISLNRGESIILRPIESREAMTANFYQMNQKILNKIIKKITQFKQIDAIFYDITNKPPATIEWE